MSIIGTMVNPYKCQQVMSAKSVQNRQLQLMEKIKYFQSKTQKDNELYRQFFELEKIGREVKEAEKARLQRNQVVNNINEISENYDDLLDRGNPFNFDYERTANNIAVNNPGNYNIMGNYNPPPGNGPQGPNSNILPFPSGGGPQYIPPGGGPQYMPPGTMTGGLNQGGFPIGGYRFYAGGSMGINPGIGQGF
jgi:hypothetical protein